MLTEGHFFGCLAEGKNQVLQHKPLHNSYISLSGPVSLFQLGTSKFGSGATLMDPMDPKLKPPFPTGNQYTYLSHGQYRLDFRV